MFNYTVSEYTALLTSILWRSLSLRPPFLCLFQYLLSFGGIFVLFLSVYERENECSSLAVLFASLVHKELFYCIQMRHMYCHSLLLSNSSEKHHTSNWEFDTWQLIPFFLLVRHLEFIDVRTARWAS